ncbi:MAG: hypothetical protein ABIA77_04465 [Candidatus Omnitrophota bacterium]
MAEKPEDYEWSSYKGYLDKKGNPYIDKKDLEKVLNMNAEQYKNFVYEGMGKEEKLFECIYAGSMLGSESFIKTNLEMLKKQIEGLDVAYKDKCELVEAETILGHMSKLHKVKKEDILSSRNKRSEAKKESIYLMKRLTGMTNKEIGDLFGIGYTSVSKVCSRMEEEMSRNKSLKKKLEQQMSHVKV